MIYNRASILLTLSVIIVCAKFSFGANNFTSYPYDKYQNTIDNLIKAKDFSTINQLSIKILPLYNDSTEVDIKYSEICKNISMSNYYLGDTNRAELFAKKSLETLIPLIPQLIYCTQHKRSIIITTKIIPILQWCQSILLLSNDENLNNLIYDTTLNIKNLLLKSDSEFLKNASTLTEDDFEITDIYYNPDSLHRTPEEKAIVYSEITPFFPNFTSFTKTNVENIKTSLTEIDVAVEFVENIIDGNIYALVLRKNYKAPIVKQICPIDTLIKCSRLGYNLYTKEHSYHLYDLIWGKLKSHFNLDDNIFFSPTNLLHQINIEVLEDIDGKSINEFYSFYRLSSTRELSIIQPKINYNSAVLYGGLKYDVDTDSMSTLSKKHQYIRNIYATRAIITDSTLRAGLETPPASFHEVTNIDNILKERQINSMVYSEEKGIEESFKALSNSNTSIIHLATHGFYFKESDLSENKYFSQFSLDSPLNRSGIVFSGAKNAWSGKEVPSGIDDGILLAKEVEYMDLNGTGLLVLSACQTGLGEITAESIFGLQRSFKMAGVQTIIMSLWDVNDNITEEFMVLFYSIWVKNRNKQQAFNEAMLKIKRKYHNLSPEYWAGFIMLDAFD